MFSVVATVQSGWLTFAEEDTWYEVGVLALNALGDGEETRVRVRTGDEPTPPAPLDVDATPINGTTIQLDWSRPSFSAPVRFYTVRFRAVRKDGMGLLSGEPAPQTLLRRYAQQPVE